MSKRSSKRRPASVYLLYDAEDELLYVGMTVAAMNRFGGHLGDKPWWQEVVRAEFKHCPSEARARRLEALLIEDRDPRYNKARPQVKACFVCGWAKAKCHGRCRTCEQYFRRHGKERPEELIVKHAERVRERVSVKRFNGVVW